MEQKDFEIVAENTIGELISKVTVVVPLYNYKDYISSCLESIKAQTIQNLELIVVDDYSIDGSLDVAYDWLDKNGARFDRYLLIRHNSNRGLAASRNTGFTQARTKFVFPLDADNLLYPRCLEVLVRALENCDASFAYCYLEKFGEITALQNTKPWNPMSLQYGNTIDAMVLLRRYVWEMVGGYSTNEVMRLGWEDFELWFKIARGGGWGILVPEILAKYRVHRSSMIHTTTTPNIGRLWQYLRLHYPEFFTEI